MTNKVPLSMVIPQELKQAMVDAAKRLNISMSALVCLILTQWLNKPDEPKL